MPDELDQARENGRRFREAIDMSDPAAQYDAWARRQVVDGRCVPVTVPCLGDGCTGCSDCDCWTVSADGGDA